MSGTVTQTDALSPAPLLEAAEQYRGTIIDLDTSRVMRADEFARTRESLTADLRKQGLQSGDRVIVAVSNGPSFLATLTAVLACEGSPLLVHFKTPPAELARYAHRFAARFLASDTAPEIGQADSRQQTVEIPFGDGTSLYWSGLDIGNANYGPTLRGIPLHPTSGSTGLPKIALRPALVALEEARHYTETLEVGGDDYIMAIPPMSHAYGYGMCAILPLLSGANLICTRRFNLQQLRSALEEYPVSILPTAPAMLDILSFDAGMDLKSLRWVLTAGAMLPRRSAEIFREKTGIIPCPLYGTTETGGISIATAVSGLDVDGRVGPAMAGVEVEVRHSESDGELGADAGKLFIRSSSMMAGYLDDQGNITKPFSDGWFETGDLARIEADGTILLRGRDSEVINVAGLKVVPCEVEEAICALSGVREARVYGGLHRSGVTIVKAAVAVETGITANDLRAHCEQQLVYYKRPQVITLVDALPRTPTGKIDRERLP